MPSTPPLLVIVTGRCVSVCLCACVHVCVCLRGPQSLAAANASAAAAANASSANGNDTVAVNGTDSAVVDAAAATIDDEPGVYNVTNGTILIPPSPAEVAMEALRLLKLESEEAFRPMLNQLKFMSAQLAIRQQKVDFYIEVRQGAPGVWVGDAKVAAVGVAVSRWHDPSMCTPTWRTTTGRSLCCRCVVFSLALCRWQRLETFRMVLAARFCPCATRE